MSITDKTEDAVNEFNQYVKPVSLWADAWKRLRRNRMAVISLWIVSFYILLVLAAPLLQAAGILFSYTEQIIDHQNLPPSFRPAGELVIERMETRIGQLEESIAAREQDDSGVDFGAGTGFDFGPAPEIVFDEGVEGEQPEEVTGEMYEEPADEDFQSDFAGFGVVDSVTDELNRLKADVEKLRGTIHTDPVHSRIYIFGTDDLGRDMLARAIYGGRISIMIGIVGTLTAVLIGILIGSISGYVGGATDNFLMRFVDIMYSLPYMLVVIIIMSIAGNKGRGSIVILFVAIALISWLTIARVVRGQIISLKNSEFVEAARSMGAGTPRIIFRHLLPNTLGVIIVFSTLLMPSFIMQESFLSFLGLGVSAPQASWGTLVSEGVRGMELRAWQLFVPAISMTLFLFCMNFLGDGLRDALDPQSKNRG